jgi:hypothetical protein
MGEPSPNDSVFSATQQKLEAKMPILLWLLGVPVTLIIILWLIGIV